MKEIDPALDILLRLWRRPGTNLRLLLNRRLERVPAAGRPAISRLVYGVVRREASLDEAIRTRLSERSKRLPIRTRILLRLGAYLLLYAESTPDHAAVNEIVRRVPQRLRGFANAVLRSIARDKQAAARELSTHPDPCVRHSISADLVRELEKISDNLEDDLDYLNTEPVFHLRAASEHGAEEKIGRILEGGGIPSRKLPLFPCLEIGDTAAVLRSVVSPGLGYLQNTASQFVSLLTARLADHAVLDACAAPGTKTVTVKQAVPELTVWANDINRRRLAMARRQLTGIGGEGVHLLVSDITSPPFASGADFDTVLVDAPCTSIGTLRKNPDLKLRVDAAEIARNAADQRRILAAIADRFPGSAVVYSVCSFAAAETEGVMEAICGNGMDRPRTCQIIDSSGPLQAYGFHVKKGRWGNYILPDRDLNPDLFYVAAFRAAVR